MKALFFALAMGSTLMLSAGYYHNQNYNNSYNQYEGYAQDSQRPYEDGNGNGYIQQNTYRDIQGNYQAASEKPATTFVNDNQIRQEIRQVLQGNTFSKGYENVTADIYNGQVTLKGTVNTTQDKQSLETKIMEITGVKEVKNQLNVQAR